MKGFYYHYKHDPKGDFNNYSYEVIGIAKHTEDETLTVAYRPLYKNTYLKGADYSTRPLKMFTGNVMVGGKTLSRFIQITDPDLILKLKKIKSEMYPEK